MTADNPNLKIPKAPPARSVKGEKVPYDKYNDDDDDISDAQVRKMAQVLSRLAQSEKLTVDEILERQAGGDKAVLEEWIRLTDEQIEGLIARGKLLERLVTGCFWLALLATLLGVGVGIWGFHEFTGLAERQTAIEVEYQQVMEMIREASENK